MLPFLIENLGDKQYGMWVLLVTTISFYSLIDAGMGSAVQRFIIRAMHEEQDGDVNTVISSAFFLFLVIAAVALGVTFLIVAIAPYFIESKVHAENFQYVIAILGIGAAVSFPISIFYGVVTSQYRFDILSIIDIAILCLKTAIIIYLINIGYGIVTLGIITAVATILQKCMVALVAKKLYPDMKVSCSLFKKNKLIEYYEYGKYTYVTMIADRLRFSIDAFVVGGTIGLAAVTHYTIASTLIHYFGQVMDALFGVIAPVLNKYHKLDQWDQLRRVFVSATELTSILAMLIGGMMLVLGDEFIELWIGDNYSDSYYVLSILCIAGIIANAQRPSVAILYAIAKHRFYAKVTVYEAIANLSISLVLVHFIGIYGVALGTLIPVLITKLLYQPRYTCKQLDLNLQKYYMILLKYACFGSGVFLIVWCVEYQFPIENYLMLIAYACLTSCIYLALALRYLLIDSTKGYLLEMAPTRIKWQLKWLMATNGSD